MGGSAVGIDVGSTNVKAVLLDPEGEVVATAARPLVWDRHGDVAEQDAEALWTAVVDCLVDLSRAAALDRVSAIGVCGQYSSIVPVDEANRPLAPMRLYLDQRGTPHCLRIMERDPDAFVAWVERHPVPPVGGGMSLGHILSFQLDSPEVHRATAAYLEPVDYVTARLTREVAATQGSVFTSLLVDNRRLGVTHYDLDLLERSGVDVSRLPRLVAPDAVVGTVDAEVATATGLPATATVRAGTTDTQAAALATGVSSGAKGVPGPAGRLGVAIGTTSVVLASTPTMSVDLEHEVLSMPGISPDRWLVWAENGLAGRAVEQIVERILQPGSGFEGFDGAIEASPPGARGLMFLPWLAGSLSPQADPSVRGGFVGMSLDTERSDLVRAAVEGVAQNLRWLLGPVEDFTGERCDEVVLVGGATRSGAWCQVVADVLGRPVRTVADAGHAGARAVATWAARPDADEPVAADRWGATFEPDPDTAPVYEEAHSRFVAVFDALRPLGLG